MLASIYLFYFIVNVTKAETEAAAAAAWGLRRPEAMFQLKEKFACFMSRIILFLLSPPFSRFLLNRRCILYSDFIPIGFLPVQKKRKNFYWVKPFSTSRGLTISLWGFLILSVHKCSNEYSNVYDTIFVVIIIHLIVDFS